MIDLIKNEEDVRKIETLILSYSKRQTGTSLPYIDIVKAYHKLTPHGNHGSRVFAALIDLKINFTLLSLDSFFAGAKWNEQNSIKLSDEENVLDNPSLFYKRFEIHRHHSNYIPRYRAIWDKIMGILLLIHSEEIYNKYNAAKSRKKAFKNLSSEVKFLEKNFADNIFEHLVKFDDNFRTPEVHRFGSLRKYSFLKSPHEEEEYKEFLSSWNYLILILIEIDKVIEAIE